MRRVILGVGLKNLIFEGKDVKTPVFLSEDYLPKIESIMTWFEEARGKKKSEIDPEKFIIETFNGEEKLAKSLLRGISWFYNYREKKLLEVLKKEEVRALAEKGIKTVENLRFYVFTLINKKYGGFLPKKNRENILKKIGKEIGAESYPLDTLVWLDNEGEKILFREGENKLTALDVISSTNFEILETLFNNSSFCRLEFLGERSVGTLAKIAIRTAKIVGVQADLSISDKNSLICELSGPFSLFGKPTKFGRNVSYVAAKLVDNAHKNDIECRIEAVFHTRRRKFIVVIPKIPPLLTPKNFKLEPIFDSSVERRFESSFNGLRGWKVIREPTPVILEDLVFVPDFKITRNNAGVMVEIIGFWRAEYSKKKLEKLKKLQQKKVKNLVFLINEKLKKMFEKPSFFLFYRLFYYKQKGKKLEIPYKQLLDYLDENFPKNTPQQKKKQKEK